MSAQVEAQGPNVFELLGIDPDQPWTLESVGRAREDARSRWNNEVNRGAGRAVDRARLNRERLTMLEAAGAFDDLSKQATKERERLAAKRALLRQQFDDEVRFAALKGTITRGEIEHWADVYAGVVTPEEIEAKARPHAAKLDHADALAPTTVGQIDEKLDLIDEESLYSLIGVTPQADRQVALRAAKKAYSDARPRAPRSSEWTIRLQLASRAVMVFDSEVQARQYLQHARQRAFYRDYVQRYEASCQGAHEISLAQVEFVLEQAKRGGWNQDEALEAIFEIAHERRWRMALPRTAGGSTGAEMRRELEKYKGEYEKYRREVEEAKRRADGERKERERLQRGLDALNHDRAEREEEIKQLQERLRQAESARQALESRWLMQRSAMTAEAQAQIAMAHSQADQLREQLRQAQARQVEEVERRIDEYAPKLGVCMARAELFTAQAIIESFRIPPPQWADYTRRIEEGISRARQLLIQAQGAGVSAVRREELVGESIALCADYQQALDYQRELPPLPPTALHATAGEQGVSLGWRASVSRGVHYVVVRGSATAPASVHDGERLATTSECGWHDPAPPPGRSLYYGVFAQRGKRVSPQGAVLADPVLLTPDVADLRAESGDGSVTLSWTPPAGASSFVVVRRQGTAPQFVDDGVRLVVRDTARYTDLPLQDGQRYYYRVYAEFLDLTGQLHRSGGMTVAAVPQRPPSAVPPVEVRGTDGIVGHSIHLAAVPPEYGELRVYRSATPPAAVGDRVPESALTRVFGPLGHPVRDMSDVLFAAERVYYTPVVVVQGMAYIGGTQRYTYCPRVSEIRAGDTGTALQVSWRWPQHCSEAEVRVAPAHGTASLGVRSATVTRTGTVRDGSYEVEALARGVYEIQVSARYRFDDLLALAEPERVSVRHGGAVVVRYALKPHGRLIGGKQYAVELHTEEGIVLPGLRVLAKVGDPPRSITDGMVIGTQPPQTQLVRTWTIPLPGFVPRSDTCIAIFAEAGVLGEDLAFQSDVQPE